MARVKFGIGTKVTSSGYNFTVVGIRNKHQRYIRNRSGEKVVDISDLRYRKK